MLQIMCIYQPLFAALFPVEEHLILLHIPDIIVFTLRIIIEMIIIIVVYLSFFMKFIELFHLFLILLYE